MWGQLCSASPGVTWGPGGSTDWPQGIYMPPQISTELRVQSEFLLKRVHNLHQILKGAVTPEKLGTQREKWQKWERDDHLGEGGDPEHRKRTSFLSLEEFTANYVWEGCVCTHADEESLPTEPPKHLYVISLSHPCAPRNIHLLVSFEGKNRLLGSTLNAHH